MGKFLLFLLLLFCASIETSHAFIPNFKSIGFDINFFINNTDTPVVLVAKPPLKKSQEIPEITKLNYEATPYLNKDKLSETDIKEIRKIINKLNVIRQIMVNKSQQRKAEELLTKLMEKIEHYNALETQDMKDFRKLIFELEKSFNDKEIISKRDINRDIIKRIRLLTPKIPLDMVNQATSIFMNYAHKLEFLKRRQKASKTLWSIEDKLQQDVTEPKEIAQLMKELIKAEKFYGCKNNKIELQRIDVLKMRITNALSQAYIMEEVSKIIEDKDFKKPSKESLSIMITNLKTIGTKSDNKYFKLKAKQIFINLREKINGESSSSTIKDTKHFENLSITLTNLMKESTHQNYKTAKNIVEEIEKFAPKIPSHNSEIITLLKKFYHYQDIYLKHEEATKILEDITRSLKHATLTEALLQQLTEELYKAQKYLKHHHETSNHEEKSHHNVIQHHKIELANALTSLNVINLAHKIVKMEKEEYAKIHQDPNVKDLLKSLEIIARENVNDIMRQSAERLIIELRHKIRDFEQFRGEKVGVKGLEELEAKLANISSLEELKVLKDLAVKISQNIKIANIKKELDSVMQKISEIEKVYYHNFEVLKSIEKTIHVPRDETEARKLLNDLKLLQEVIESPYKETKLTEKANELAELIKANLKDFQHKNKISKVSNSINQVQKTMEMSQNKQVINDGINKLEMLESQLGNLEDVEEHHEDDVKEALNKIQKIKQNVPLKIELQKNAEVLHSIVEQFIKQMTRINTKITQIDDELKIIEEFNSNKIDLTPFKSRKDFIQKDYDRILNELNETKLELVKMNLSQYLSANETFGKDNVTMSDVIDKLVKLDNLLSDPTTSSLYKATFKDAQEVEHIESVIEQLKKMIERLKKYVKTPTTNNANQSSTEHNLMLSNETIPISESTTGVNAVNANDLNVTQNNVTPGRPGEAVTSLMVMQIKSDEKN